MFAEFSELRTYLARNDTFRNIYIVVVFIMANGLDSSKLNYSY